MSFHFYTKHVVSYLCILATGLQFLMLAAVLLLNMEQTNSVYTVKNEAVKKVIFNVAFHSNNQGDLFPMQSKHKTFCFVFCMVCVALCMLQMHTELNTDFHVKYLLFV
jgi:hypothetical protein